MLKKHGGPRSGSGAKQKYGEPTKIVTFRIPESKKKDIKKLVYDYLIEYLTKIKDQKGI